MEKAAYHELLAEVGGGGDEIGAEAQESRRHRELEVQELLNERFGGVLLLGDALHQFYMDTLRHIYIRLSEHAEPNATLHYYAHWHCLSAARYYTAFDLFRRGYYFECGALARTLWETALTLAGIKRNIVQVEELFGGRTEPETVTTAAAILESVKAADRRIEKALLWENAQLNKKGKDALNDFRWIANQCTHKSNLGMTVIIDRQQRKQPIHLFPFFDAKLAGMAANSLFLSMRCLMVTLSYLEHLLPDDGRWRGRYEKLLLAFEVQAENSPSTVVQGFGELIQAIFQIQVQPPSAPRRTE